MNRLILSSGIWHAWAEKGVGAIWSIRTYPYHTYIMHEIIIISFFLGKKRIAHLQFIWKDGCLGGSKPVILVQFNPLLVNVIVNSTSAPCAWMSDFSLFMIRMKFGKQR